MTVLDTGLPPRPAFTFAPNALLTPAGAGTVEQVMNHVGGFQRIKLTLTNVKVVVTDALAYGSALLGYLPNSNLVFIGGETNLTYAKDGTGILSTENPKFALGRAAASNATLSSTMSNMINGGAAAGTAIGATLTGAVQFHSNDNVTAIPFLAVLDSATSGVYLNLSVNPTGDGSVVFNGDIDLYFINLGKLS